MIVWKIENYRTSREIHRAERVYDELIDYFATSAEDAIEAESWSELACVGEVYHGENFRITVEEV